MRSVGFLLLLAAPLLGADPVAAVREAAAGWTQAVVKQDRAALNRLLADDLRYSHANGRSQNKAEYIEAVASGPPRYESFEYSDLDIRVYGKTAVLTGFCEVKMAGTEKFRVRTLHVYLKRGGRWQFAAHQSARVQTPEALFIARPLTSPHSFDPGVEGPAVDREGNIYAVSFARKPTIGRIRPDGTGEVWIDMPEGSLGNGIRFDRAGMMYVADYTGHNVLRIDPATRRIEVFAHEPTMNQPNDLAISADGTLWASDPNWKERIGQVWRIDTDGKVTRVAADMGTTNGIEVSPDGRTLYVNESVQRKVWAFTIEKDRSLSNKRPLIEFPDHGMDGMRCDVAGNLYVTRYGKGTVAIVSPEGKILREVDVLGARPSNIAFGGPDGRTAYVTEVEHGRLVQFRTERPGIEWQRLR